MSKEKENNSPCFDCKSKSMEECLLVRHCQYWLKSKNRKEKENE